LKLNPWDFSKSDEQIFNKMTALYAGARYWLWYVNSGFWCQGKLQFANYRITGTWRPALDEGTAIGTGVSAGYSFMLTNRINLDLGLGAWAGYLARHNLYECSDCLRLRESESGPGGFLDWDHISVSLTYIF